MRFFIHAAAMSMFASPPSPAPVPPPSLQVPTAAATAAQASTQAASAQAVPGFIIAQVTSAPPATAQTAPAPRLEPPVEGTRTPRTRRANSNRQTLAQRFEQANTTKDGHLTQDQAAAVRWTYITRNFDGIDKGHKGWISAEDIRGYARERRAARLQQEQRDTTAPTHG